MTELQSSIYKTVFDWIEYSVSSGYYKPLYYYSILETRKQDVPIEDIKQSVRWLVDNGYFTTEYLDGHWVLKLPEAVVTKFKPPKKRGKK